MYLDHLRLVKGGAEGKTYITYTLSDNAEVTITLYDLLGYVVREFKFTSGADGGKPRDAFEAAEDGRLRPREYRL